MFRIWCSVCRSASRSFSMRGWFAKWWSPGFPLLADVLSLELRGDCRVTSLACGSLRAPLRGACLVARPDQGLAALLRIVLAERVALELFVEQQPARIGMAGEAHAVHVPHLALHPVRGGPERAERVDLAGLFGDAGLDAEAVVPRHGVEVVDHLEARGLTQIVDARHVGEHVEGELGRVAQEAHHLDEAILVEQRGGVAEPRVRGDHRAGVVLEQAPQQRRAVVLHQLLRGGACTRSYSARRNSRRRFSRFSGTSSCSFWNSMSSRVKVPISTSRLITIASSGQASSQSPQNMQRDMSMSNCSG